MAPRQCNHIVFHGSFDFAISSPSAAPTVVRSGPEIYVFSFQNSQMGRFAFVTPGPAMVDGRVVGDR
jgi:hypothetical protein